MSFVIEPLTKGDVEQCVNILSSAAKEMLPTDKDKESLKRLIYGVNTLSLTAKKDKRIVGIISGMLQMTPHINFVFVADEESARQGLGGLLIDKFLETAKKQLSTTPPYATTSLTTDNTAAVSLYSAKGFKVEGFLKEGLMGKDIIFLKKKL